MELCTYVVAGLPRGVLAAGLLAAGLRVLPPGLLNLGGNPSMCLKTLLRDVKGIPISSAFSSSFFQTSLSTRTTCPFC